MITKEEFERYEKVRVSGRTNMLMVSNVAILSRLSFKKVCYIINDYGNLKEKFAICEVKE